MGKRVYGFFGGLLIILTAMASIHIVNIKNFGTTFIYIIIIGSIVLLKDIITVCMGGKK